MNNYQHYQRSQNGNSQQNRTSTAKSLGHAALFLLAFPLWDGNTGSSSGKRSNKKRQ